MLRGYNTDNITEGLQFYHLFGLFWYWQLFIAIEQTAIAGVVGIWYWTPVKKVDIKTIITIAMMT